MKKILVAGGAGFIGSHMVSHLIDATEAKITVFDNFSSGQRYHLETHLTNPRLEIINGDLKDLDAIKKAIEGADRIYHFASNPDIAKAIAQPDIDFWEGTYLTQNLLEAVRQEGVKQFVYASGSGVYGDVGDFPVTEDYAPMHPISPYGASKLSCEVTIHAYCHMFGIRAWVYRFANVVGNHQTHGVAYDFIHNLRKSPDRLRILGDGSQSKSYIHVSDVVAGIQHFVAHDSEPFNYYHLATTDYLTVTEIANIVAEEMGIENVVYDYAGGDRGWRGDVPVVRFDLSKVHGRGWKAKLSARQAMRAAIQSMLEQTV